MEGWGVVILFPLLWHSILFSLSEQMLCFGPISSYYDNIVSKLIKNTLMLNAWLSYLIFILLPFFQEFWEIILFSNCRVAVCDSCWLECSLCWEKYAFPFKCGKTFVEWGNIYFASNTSVKCYDKTLDDVLCVLILMEQWSVSTFHCIWFVFNKMLE